LGITLQELGRLEEAEKSYKKAIEIKPEFAEAHSNMGALLKKLGRLEAAAISYRKAILIKPEFAEVHSNLGVTLEKLGRFEEAAISYKKAIEIKPEYAEAHFNLGNALKELGRLEEAEASYKKAIVIKPDFAEAHSNLGNLLKELGRLEDAEISCKKAIAIKPEFSEAHNNLGNTLEALGRLKEAEASYKKSIVIKPEYAEAHSNLGITLQLQFRFKEAETSYRKAIAINSQYAEAHSNLGNVLKELGKLEEAEASYKKSISIKPENAEVHSNLGITLQLQFRLKEAETSYRKAIEIKPNFAQAHSNLGSTLQALLRLEEAEASYKSAIAINPDLSEPYNNLGTTLKELCRLEEAEKSYRKAIELNPELATALQNYSSLLAFMSNYSGLRKFSDDALKIAELNLTNADALYKIWESRLYNFIYHPDLSAEEICDEHKRWGSKYAHLGQTGFADHDRTPKRRLRVGYVSPDFRGHTCRFYFEPLFSQHDHSNFEVFAYSNVLHVDEHTARFKSYFDHWRNILGVSDETVADTIRKDKIDILVDGCGHMMDTRLTVFAHKPAPIQVTWLGAAWTTGLPQMDYVLFDPYMAPEGTAASEQIVHLPRTWAAFRPGESATKVSVKASPSLKNGYITFGYSGRSERLNYRVFNVWGRILARLPQARLVLDYKAFVDPKTQAYYKEFLATHGLDTNRVLMRKSENIFEGLGDIDILLDSFPHNGGTMLFDAIWMGVPVLTLTSPRPVGRIGTSLMTNLGLPEWVAKDEQEYEDKAVAFAQNITALVSLRSEMRGRMQASPVMDEKAFAQEVENAFQDMWTNWVNSLSQVFLNSRNY
jgi:protein O-GlcNAc transferase